MRRIRVLLVSLVGLVVLGGCSSGSRYEPSGNPILDMRNPDLLTRDRVRAVEDAWAEVEAGVRVRERTRQAMKNLAWSSATAPELRYTALDLLMGDTSEVGDADSARMARLMLPTETDREATRIILVHAIRAGWDGLVPAIVRSYARPSPGFADEERMERKALEALVPGEPIESVIFGVFLDPLSGASEQEERSILRVAERTRDDAWGLLARLDPDRSIRERLVRSADSFGAMGSGARLAIDDLRVCARDFGVIPDRAMELAWLRQLRRSEDPDEAARNRVWWGETRDAVGALSAEQKRGLEMRHLEAVRFASIHRPEWSRMGRSALLGVLADRLSGRLVYKRDADEGEGPRRERLGDWETAMDWADVLTVLVVDDAVRSAAVVDRIDTQAALDRKDTSTEYGGVIDLDANGDFRAVLFRPRQRDRVSDMRFVASDDMLRFSDRALVHYHFHVNERNNNEYAGPSAADLLYVAASGRTSVVFTSIREEELNVDVYQPDGVVIDLGVVVRP